MLISKKKYALFAFFSLLLSACGLGLRFGASLEDSTPRTIIVGDVLDLRQLGFQSATASSQFQTTSELYFRAVSEGTATVAATSESGVQTVEIQVVNPISAISGLSFWFRADDSNLFTDVGATSRVTDGDGVRAAHELSSNHNHLSAYRNPPTYKASGIGGRPAIEFFANGDGSANNLASANPTSSSTKTFFAVARPMNSTPNFYNYWGEIFCDAMSTTGWTTGGMAVLSDNPTFSFTFQSQATPNSAQGTTWASLEMSAIPSSTYTYDQDYIIVSRVPYYVSTTPAGIGGAPDGWLPFQGRIAEVVVFDRDLTELEVTRVTNYLKARYQIGL